MQGFKVNELITYALGAAIENSNAKVIKDCIEHGAIVTPSIMMKYITKATDPRNKYGIPHEHNIAYHIDPIFEAFIHKLPIDTLFDHKMVEACMQNANTYYLEAILSTQRYHDSDDNNSNILYFAASDKRVPQHAIDLLIKYGFTATSSLVMDFIEGSDFPTFSRLTAAGINLTNHYSAIFTFIMSSHQENLTRKTVQNGFQFRNYPWNIRNTIQLLITYLRSDPNAIFHFMTVKYLIFEIIQPSINQSDISAYIWNQYLDSTVKIYGHHVTRYEEILDTLKS